MQGSKTSKRTLSRELIIPHFTVWKDLWDRLNKHANLIKTMYKLEAGDYAAENIMRYDFPETVKN